MCGLCPTPDRAGSAGLALRSSTSSALGTQETEHGPRSPLLALVVVIGVTWLFARALKK